MSYMFYHAYSFNADIGGWDTSALERMDYMFYLASSLDQDWIRPGTGTVSKMPVHGASR